MINVSNGWKSQVSTTITNWITVKRTKKIEFPGFLSLLRKRQKLKKKPPNVPTITKILLKRSLGRFMIGAIFLIEKLENVQEKIITRTMVKLIYIFFASFKIKK